jgi:CRISPR-associated protein Csb2
MLALKVEYLTGVCMATAHDDPHRSTPEWPPHPDRLYSALVAAAATLPEESEDCLPSHAKDALSWLAEQCWSDAEVIGPELHASDAYRRLAPDVHMPSNPDPTEIPVSLEVSDRAKDPVKAKREKEKSIRNILPVFRKKTALPIPAVVPEEPTMYFIWKNAEPSGHLETLRNICDRVSYLGRSRSLVRVSIVENAPRVTHTPDPLGQIQLRVPGGNRLEELEQFYNQKGGKPDPCPPRRYRRVTDQTQSSEVIESILDRMFVFRPRRGDLTLPAVTTLRLTQSFRRALIACIEAAQKKNGLNPDVPDIVHGHGQHPHCAYLALPFVHAWQRYADGAIKGLAIVVPKGAKREELQTIALGLEMLQENGLGIPGVGTWDLEEVDENDPPLWSLAARTWRGPSRVWTTVTPMVFGHFPKRSKGGERTVILESLAMIGIDSNSVIEIGVGQHSPLHGALPSGHFKPHPHALTERQLPRHIRHITLRFNRPVEGPLLVGAMRYFGLGLMLPLKNT